MNENNNQWIEEWLTSVANRSSTVSQRKLSCIDKHGGGTESIKAVAQQKGVHLPQITDNKGVELVAASTRPFTVIR